MAAELDDDGRAIIPLQVGERLGEGAELRARIVADTLVGPARVIGATSSQRASGFPRMARRGSDVVVAWAEPGDTSRVRAAAIHLTQR